MRLPPSLILKSALLLLPAATVQAATVSNNTGSLGAAANGSNADAVVSGAGAVSAGGDSAAVYDDMEGTETIVAFQPALNPIASNPFSVEFWANPAAWDDDDSPVSNRKAAGDRSGWAFYQRDAADGWNFRMYDGDGSALGWNLTGGTANLNEWSHVVATWDGSVATLYVNGQLADSTNDNLSGAYNPNTVNTTNFLVAATDTASPFNGSVDEVAFYASVLSPTQIGNHFATAASPTPGAYHEMVRADGALLQLSNNAVPEPAALGFLGLAGLGFLTKRRRNQAAV